MIKKSILNCLVNLSVLVIATASTTYAAAENFSCPNPTEIQSTNFTAPSIWLGPPMPHSVANAVGVGLGGKKVKAFIGAQAAVVNNKDGWVCVYHSEEGVSVNEYQYRIKHLVTTNKYLTKYLARVNQELENAEPYLKNYPQNIPLGFVGYQKAQED